MEKKHISVNIFIPIQCLKHFYLISSKFPIQLVCIICVVYNIPPYSQIAYKSNRGVIKHNLVGCNCNIYKSILVLKIPLIHISLLLMWFLRDHTSMKPRPHKSHKKGFSFVWCRISCRMMSMLCIAAKPQYWQWCSLIPRCLFLCVAEDRHNCSVHNCSSQATLINDQQHHKLPLLQS